MSFKSIPESKPDLILSPEPGKEVCDFCSTPHPRFTIPCQSFSWQIGGFKQTSDGDWAACDDCAALIAAEKWDDLTERSIDTYRESFILEPMAREFLNGLHQHFRDNRIYKTIGSGMYVEGENDRHHDQS